MGPRLLVCALLMTAGAALSGCASPSKANIDLRKRNAELLAQIQQLQTENAGLSAQVRQGQPSTVPALALERLRNLFTTHGLTINRLSTGSDLKRQGRGDTGIRLYVAPTDDHGNPLQATGHFSIDAFDLSQRESPLIGHWEFGPADCKENWYGGMLRYSYIFELPWARAPKQEQVTVRVKFTDELTGRVFTGERIVRVSPMPATAPATAPGPVPAAAAGGEGATPRP